MADKISKVIIDIISRGGANAAAQINNLFKEAVRSGAAQEKFEQRQELQRQKLAQQSADKQKALNQQSAQFAEKMAEARRRSDEKAFQAAQAAHEKTIQRRVAEERRAATEIERINRRTASEAAKSAKSTEQAYARTGKSISGAMSSIAGGLASAGATLSATVTVPLVALATLSSRSAIAVDDLNNKLISATGSIEGANRKMAEFRKLSADSVGVLINFAAETYAFLKPMQIGEGVISKFTQALGRIKLTDSTLDTTEFSRNMGQLFSQNFEMQDLKQLVGRFPRAAELIAKQFGFNSSDLGTIQEGLQGMKKAGKLTLEGFLQGFSESVENDPALGKLSETFGSRLAKAAERLNLALAPIGAVILGAIVPALEYLAPYLESAINWFGSLSPIIQAVIVAVGGFVAALGPVLIVAAGVVSAIASIATGIVAVGGLVVVLKVAGIAILAVIGIFIQLAPAILTAVAAVAALYAAWQTNFGGIRDYTIAAWNAIKSAISTAMTFIYGVVQTVGGALVSWWRENYPQIKAVIESVSESIKSYVQGFLNAINAFWQEHGERIKTYVSTAWESAKMIIAAVMQYIGEVVKIGLKILQGDWQGAWDAFIKGTENLWRNITAIFLRMKDALVSFFKAVAPMIGEYFGWWLETTTKWTIKIVGAVVYFIATLPQQIIELAPKFYQAGLDIVGAIWRGIKEGWSGQNLPSVVVATTENQTNNNNQNRAAASVAASVAPTVISTTPTSGLSDEESKKRQKEREDAAKRDAAAQIQILRNQLAEVEKEYDETLNKLREKLKENGDGQAFADGWNSLATSMSAELLTLYSQIEGAEDKLAAQEKKRDSELELLRQEQQKRRDDFQRKSDGDRQENYKLLAEMDKKASEQSVKNLEEVSSRKLALDRASAETRLKQLEDSLRRGIISELEYEKAVAEIKLNSIKFEKAQLAESLVGLDQKSEKYAEITNKIAILDEQLTQQQIENAQKVADALDKATEARGRFVDGGEQAEGFGAETDPDGGTPQRGLLSSIFGAIDFQGEADVMVGIGQMISDTFNSIANAVGNSVAAFVKFGSAGGSFRKFAAELLASVAQMAAVQAVWNLAEGFAKLAMAFFGHPTAGASAAMHFKAAAVYGGIAIGAALIGRSVAGNEFKDQRSSQGFANSANQSTSAGGGGSRGAGGQVYSGFGDDASVVNVGRNAPSEPQEVVLRIKDKSNWFSDMFEIEYKKNGRLRTLLNEG